MGKLLLWSKYADKKCGEASGPMYYVDGYPQQACRSHLYVTNVKFPIAFCVESPCFELAGEGKTVFME